MTGYCIKCKSKQEMKNPQERATKKGGKCCVGTCSGCDKKISVFLKKS